MSFEIKNGVLKKYTEEDGVTEVTIPDGVTSIGARAFYDCISLTSITIPNSVTSIGESAFSYCKSLTGITIPDGVTSIGDSAFWYCEKLESITIPNSVTSIGDSAFWGCISLTSIIIPDSVKSIREWVFRYCSNLTSIIIPDSVTSIGNSAFEHCKSLTSVTIPDSVISIGACAFSGCEKLTSITIPDSVTSIRIDAFPAGKKIIICKNDIKVPFILKDAWNDKKPERLLNDFIFDDVNNRPKYFDEMKPYYKIPLALFMVFAYPQESSDYLNYLKKSVKKAVTFMTDEENIELLYKFLELGFVTKKNIDSLISYAVEHTQNGGSAEPQLILSKYKSDNFGVKGADSFDKLML